MTNDHPGLPVLPTYICHQPYTGHGGTTCKYQIPCSIHDNPTSPDYIRRWLPKEVSPPSAQVQWYMDEKYWDAGTSDLVKDPAWPKIDLIISEASRRAIAARDTEVLEMIQAEKTEMLADFKEGFIRNRGDVQAIRDLTEAQNEAVCVYDSLLIRLTEPDLTKPE